ncbi:MAG TPA: MarR family winged helix-turn-helix transcriptional regulator [candidate division Zixibacteria bacterium]|nr:MarR family winged helix-turn-helix transcriptional regulator [candidate division Zixibacteria bacterium]
MDSNDHTLSDKAFRRVLALLRYARQHARQLIDKRGIKPRQFSVLRYLLDSGPVTVGQVQNFVQNSPSTTSKLIAQLEESGYVTRTRSSDDNRVVIVELTDLGRDLAQTTSLVGLPLLRRRLQGLPQERLVEIDDVLQEIMRLMGAEIEA